MLPYPPLTPWVALRCCDRSTGVKMIDILALALNDKRIRHMAMETDEIECIVANLIYAGYVKGYIAHQHGKVVLSKQDAFPALADVAGGK